MRNLSRSFVKKPTMSSRYRLLSARLKGFRQHAKVRGWRRKHYAEMIVFKQETAEVRKAWRELKAMVESLAKSYAMD